MAFEFAGVAVIAFSNMFIMILINKRAKEEKHQSLDGQEVSVMVRGFIVSCINEKKLEGASLSMEIPASIGYATFFTVRLIDAHCLYLVMIW